jgi:hypothetical protein
MKTLTSQLILALAMINSLTSAASLPVSKRGGYGRNPKPAAFYLAGDSTTCALYVKLISKKNLLIPEN